MHLGRGLVVLALTAGISGCEQNPTLPTPPPAPPSFLTFGAVSPGDEHTCGITTDGSAYCWGDNVDGQLGNGTAADWVKPARVAAGGGLHFMSVDAGFRHTCAITTDGAAYCWGHGGEGELGDGTGSDHAVPTAVASTMRFTGISASFVHSCGLVGGGGRVGALYCWGQNGYGQLGDGTTSTRASPVAVSGGLTFATATTGYVHTCGVTTVGAAYCWGQNSGGQLGDSTTTDRSSPVAVLGGLTFVTVRAGYFHTCGITTQGAVYCWGDNRSGQLGNGTTVNEPGPVAVQGGLKFLTISAGNATTCGVTMDFAPYCWGRNSHGELGDGTTIDRSTPTLVDTQVPGGISVFVLSSGGGHTCFITGAYAAYCWGENLHGQVGDGTKTDRDAPVRVAPQ